MQSPAGEEIDPFRASLIALGDFNITTKDDIIFKALVDNGLQPDVETLESRGPSRTARPARSPTTRSRGSRRAGPAR